MMVYMGRSCEIFININSKKFLFGNVIKTYINNFDIHFLDIFNRCLFVWNGVAISILLLTVFHLLLDPTAFNCFRVSVLLFDFPGISS